MHLRCLILTSFLSLYWAAPTTSDGNHQKEFECGIMAGASANAFKGTKITSQLEYPWKVAILQKGVKYICGGTLISDRKVVSAAHCFKQKKSIDNSPVSAKGFIALLGALDLSLKGDEEPNRVFAEINKIQLHDGWNLTEQEYSNDIAVLHLKEPVKLSDYIRPVCLVKTEQEEEEILKIPKGEVVGWGKIDNENSTDFPYKVTLNMVDDRSCVKKDKHLVDILPWVNAFCAGNTVAGIGGVCNGDSGSGYFVRENRKFYLRGIVSVSAIEKCEDSKLAVYMDALGYLDFFNV